MQRFLPLGMDKLCGAGCLDHALNFLEHSRALFWTQTLRLRTDLSAVPAPSRDRFHNLTRQLEPITGSFAPLTGDAMLTIPEDEETDRAGRLAANNSSLAECEDVLDLHDLDDASTTTTTRGLGNLARRLNLVKILGRIRRKLVKPVYDKLGVTVRLRYLHLIADDAQACP